jgi:hypothetical protein
MGEPGNVRIWEWNSMSGLSGETVPAFPHSTGGRRPHLTGAALSIPGARLPRPAQPHIVHPMRMLIGIVLLLVQLRPVLGAGACLQASAHADQRCSSPMNGMPSQDSRLPQGSPESCPLMAVCIPGGPVLPQVATRLFNNEAQALLPHSNPVASLPADPIAPPKPPPIV